MSRSLSEAAPAGSRQTEGQTIGMTQELGVDEDTDIHVDDWDIAS